MAKAFVRRSGMNSPAVDCNKRPSYLEISMSLPGNTNYFDEGVIRKLEPQFNDAKEELLVGREDGEDEEFEQIKTYLRIRPYTKKSEDEVDLIEIKDDKTVIANCAVPGALGKRTMKKMEFKFTKVLNESCSQEQVYEDAVEPLLDQFDNGENCLIFSYGSTNSGKTYTMRGSSTKYGVIPRTLYHIFDRYQDRIYKGGDVQPFRHESTRELLPDQYKILLDKKKLLILAASDTTEMRHRPMNIMTTTRMSTYNRRSDASSHCTSVRYIGGACFPPDMDHNRSTDSTVFGMWVSFVELYNEKCYDLLSYGRRSEVKIVSEKGGYSYFKDVVELPVFNEEEAFALYIAGCNKLEVSATLINETSSRSHSFFTIRVVELGRTAQSVYPIKVHRMTFSDLAGCERVRQTENKGGQLRESANINQSLLSLLRVIRMIRNKQSHSQTFLEKIPFRDSKLTRIFQGYFTTSTHIAMIVNVNPVPKMVDSSVQTLINSAIASNVVAFRSKPPNVSVMSVVEHAPGNLSFLHSSLDLEDVMEETEEEVDEEENRPLSHVSLSFSSKAVSENTVPHESLSYSSKAVTVAENTIPAPAPLVLALRMNGILKEKNLIGSPNDTKKNVLPKFNDFKMPKPIEKENVIEANNQPTIVEVQSLLDTIAHLNTEIMLRDRVIESLNGRIKTVEAETREQMLQEMDVRMQSVRDREQRNYTKKLEWSDQRSSQFRSRLAVEGKQTVATQTDDTT